MAGPIATATRGNVTVPIYRVRARETWTHVVAWYEGGKRRRKAFEALPDAEKHAASVAASLAQHGAARAVLAGKEAREYQEVMEIVGKRNSTLLSAVREWDAAQEARGIARGRAARVVDVVTEFMAAKERAGRSHQHLRDLRARLDRFRSAFRGELDAVTQNAVIAWLDSLAVGPRTRRNYLGAVSNLVRYAERRGHVPRGQIDLSGIERSHTEREIEIWTPEELTALLALSRRDMVPFLALGAFAGLRTAEIRRLTWEEITAEHIDIRAAKAKTRQRRLVPVIPPLADWLRPHRAEGLVCPLVEPWDALRKLVRDTGLTWKINGLRHSFGSYRLALVKSDAQVALEMGNSPAMIFRHYRAVVTEERARKWFGIRPF